MRPKPVKALALIVVLLFDLIVVCRTATAQPERPLAFPATIISSGGSVPNSMPAESTVSTDARRGVAEPRWTAESAPIAGNLRPQQQGTVAAQMQSDALHVVTASAQLPLADSSMVASGLSRTADSSGSVRHIPLAPPSARFKGDEKPESASTLQMLISVGSSLLLVVGLFLGVAWCYRKTLSSSINGGLPKQVVSVLGRTSISTRQQMVLVRFGSKLLLVSVIQGEARTLGEITDPLEVDQIVGQCESSQPGSITNSFRNVLLQGAVS